MANIITVPTYDSIYQIEATDDVQGGLGGISNVQAQALGDRDDYLLSIIGGSAGVTTILSSVGVSQALTVAQVVRNFVNLEQDTNAYLTVTLPQAALMGIGQTANLGRFDGGVTTKPVTINVFAGDAIIDQNSVSQSTIYLHANERISLTVSAAGIWQVTYLTGNINNVGDQMFGYVLKAGTLKRDGTAYNRADYPRLWAWIDGNSLWVTDAAWATNKGAFSNGDGTTTFRLPDDRAMFDRALDLGALIDTDRNTAGTGSTPGSSQAGAFASHTHTFTGTPHTHTFTGTPHTHTITDPGHNHAITDPGHNHTITDPGHLHNNDWYGAGSTSGNKGVPQGSTTPNVWPSDASTTGISINTNVTGISINTNTTGISNANATAGGTNANTTAGGTNANQGGAETRPINVGKLPLIIF